MTDKTLNLGTKFLSDVRPLLNGITQVRTALQGFSVTANQVKAQTGQLGKSMKSVGVAGAAAARPTQQLGAAHAVLGKQIGSVVGGLERIKSAMRVTVSYGVAATVIFGFVNALKAGTTAIIDFDQALKNIQAITGATESQLLAMTDVMLELARETKFSSTEISEGMVLLGQAGFSAEESLNAIKATSMLATGTLTNLATTADLLTTTIRAFNLESIEAGRVADVFANAVNKSKLTVDKLRVAFNFVGASAAQAGMSIEQTAAATMVLANNGLRASTIGTGLRQVLAKLVAPSEKLRESFAAHGIDLAKVNAEGFDFRKTLKYLAPLLIDTKTRTVDMAKAFELFKLRGAQAAAILIKGIVTSGPGGFDDMIRKVNEVGTAAAMASIQQEGLAVKFKNLQDRAGALALAVGNAGAAGALRVFVDVVKAAITAAETFVRSGFGGMALQATALTAVFFGLTKGILALKAAIVGSWLLNFRRSLAVTGVVNALTQSFGKMNLILLAATAVISAVIVGFNYLRGSLRRAAEEHDKTAVQMMGFVKGLNLYREVLTSLHNKKDVDSAETYRATIKRLASEYENLGSQTDLLALSHENLMTKIDDELAQKADRGLKESLATAMNYRRIRDRMISQHDQGTSRYPLSSKGIQFDEEGRLRKEQIKELPEIAAATEQVVAARQRMIDMLLELMEIEHLNVEQAEDWLVVMKDQGLLAGTVEENLNTLNKALENLKENFATFSQITGTKKMAEEFKQIFDSLSLTGKIDFLKGAKGLQSKIAGLKKIMQDFGIAEEEIQVITDRLTLSFLELQGAQKNFFSIADTAQANEWNRWFGSGGFEILKRDQVDRTEKAKENVEAIAEAIKKIREEVAATLSGRVDNALEDAFAELDLDEYNYRVFKTARIDEELADFFDDIKVVLSDNMGAQEWARFMQFDVLQRDSQAVLSVFEQMSPAIRKIYEGLSDVQKMEFVKEFLSLQSSIKDVTDQMEEMGFSAEQISAAVKNMTRDFGVLTSDNTWGGIKKGLRDYTEEVKYAAKNWYEFTGAALHNIEDGFAGLFDNVAHGAANLGDIWDNLIDSMISDWSRLMSKMVMDAAISGFGGVISSMFPSSVGYGTTWNGGQTAGYKAAGGPVSAGRPYIVGEKGKELFVPGQSGQIIPNSSLTAPEVNVVVNNHSGQPAKTTETQGPGQSRQIFITIGNDIVQGGPVASAIERTYGVNRRGRKS